MATLFLLRHGKSIYNANKTVQGSDPDPRNVLTQEGEEQSRVLGNYFNSLRFVPASAWSSPLPRASQTCDIVLGVMGCRLSVRKDPRLKEMCKGSRGLPGGLEGRPSKEVKTLAYREQYQRLGWDFRHGSLESGGETARESGLRFKAVMNVIADSLPNNAVGLVFSHGQAIRFGVGATMGFPDINQLNTGLRLGNCQGLIMSRSARQWQFKGRLPTS